MSKDYYWILRVDRAADASQIKEAYRRIAKESHPDTAGPEKSTERFLEVKEAYETLVDKERRRKYDEELRKRESSPENRRRTVGGGRGRGFPMSGEARGFPWFDDISDRLWDGFFGRQREDHLHFEAILSPDEAQRGGLYPISVNLSKPCPRCGNRRSHRPFCVVCLGAGKVESARRLSLSIPPGIRSGSRIRIALEDTVPDPIYVNITVRIEPFSGEPW